MVQVINQSVCGGIAGRRPNATPKGVVIHNDAGSIYATAAQYVNALAVMSPTQLANGFAHYYIDRNTIARVEDTFNAKMAHSESRWEFELRWIRGLSIDGC